MQGHGARGVRSSACGPRCRERGQWITCRRPGWAAGEARLSDLL